MYCKTSPNSGGLGFLYKHTVVIVSSGSYCKPHAGWLINNIISFLPVLWPASPKFRMSAWSSSGETPPLRCRLLTFPCILTWWRAERGSKLSSLCKIQLHQGAAGVPQQLATWTTNKKGEVASGLYICHLWMKAYFSLDWYWSNWYWSKGRLLIHVELKRKLWFDNRQVASSSFTIIKMTCSFSSQLFI